MKFKTLLKRAVKAFMPYGLLALYRRSKIMRLKIQNLQLKMNAVETPKKPESISPLLIVTLTSYGHRVKNTAPYAIRSILNQSIKPDKIILWLAYGTKIPKPISTLTKYGLEIKFCEDMRSYKKLVPALKEFPNDVLITADDDVLYPNNWFEEFKTAYMNGPDKIYCHRAHEICLDENKNIISYNEWRKCVRTIENPKRLFPTGLGGILYPPHSLDSRCLNAQLFSKLAPTADDVWFWAMARLKKTKCALVKNICRDIVDIDNGRDGLYLINTGKNGKNDTQIKAIMEYYPEIMAELV